MFNNKILLLTCSVEDESRSAEIQYNSHYPLGLAYIHSCLEKHGFEVKTLFLNDYAYDDCLKITAKEIEEFNPIIVGLQIISHNRVMSYRIVDYISKEHPRINIVAGGIHASIMYEQILIRFPFLVVIIGEGEDTMLDLACAMANQHAIDSIPGIAFVHNGKVVKTIQRELIADLDSLPFPKHAIFFNDKRTYASIMTSRGCPFNCSFCVLSSISRGKVRYRSARNVVDEIEYLAKTFPGLETIWIHDDTFFLRNDRAIEVCNEIVKRAIKLKFICSAKFKPISKELISALERAGFIHVLFGLESGSAKILKSCHKQVTPQEIIRAVELFRDSPIEITAFLIVGLYGEDSLTIKETARLVQKMQMIKYFIYDDIGILAVYPGTEVYSISKSAKKIEDDYWLTDKPVPFFTVEHDYEQLLALKEELLNHISIKRLPTFAGFKAQLSMLPYLLIKHPKLVLASFKKAIKRMLCHYISQGRNV